VTQNELTAAVAQSNSDMPCVLVIFIGNSFRVDSLANIQMNGTTVRGSGGIPELPVSNHIAIDFVASFS